VAERSGLRARSEFCGAGLEPIFSAKSERKRQRRESGDRRA
jgi:hypothetical protein